ncbi:hypothetical protein EVAR_66050_1 [Eumeta japonica]|uniref:Uncharacterized protein n=1 Tax=Eumeta variegata TaxID=151549 RepID=A0A4C2AGU1_EUMVA|nr:hypothetical protein EVAR_66050_1 [Eumeta japonica]
MYDVKERNWRARRRDDTGRRGRGRHFRISGNVTRSVTQFSCAHPSKIQVICKACSKHSENLSHALVKGVDFGSEVPRKTRLSRRYRCDRADRADGR